MARTSDGPPIPVGAGMTVVVLDAASSECVASAIASSRLTSEMGCPFMRSKRPVVERLALGAKDVLADIVRFAEHQPVSIGFG